MPRRLKALLLPAGLLVLGPLAIRLLALLELERSPFFRLLLVDARTYHEMAVSLARGTFERHEPFWQPPFYPYLLGLVYKLAGPVPEAARIFQAILGSLSCLLVFRLGERWFGRRAAWIAWAAASLCGPLLFFDLQILNAGTAIFLLLLGIERISADPARRAWIPYATGGLALGLASITVATLAPVILIAAAWLWVRSRSGLPPAGVPASGGRRDRRHLAALRTAVLPFLFAAALPVAVVFTSNLAVSGQPVLISTNGGVNFWIGNNPDYERTVAIRPGRAWTAFVNEPVRAGAASPSAASAWWTRKALGWGASHPGAWARLLLYKARLVLRGDEIARNQEIYPFRDASVVLRVLLWVQGIAFPTGILLPLAAVGAFLAFRRRPDRKPCDPSSRLAGGPALAVAIAASVLLGTVLFFVASRYRLPAIPFAILLAAGGVDRFLSLRGRARVAPAVIALLLAVVCNAGIPPVPREFNSDAWSDLGLAESEAGRMDSAERAYARALELNPDNPEAAHGLGTIRMKKRDYAGAETLYKKVLAAWPDDPNALVNLGNIRFYRQDPYGAGDFYSRALAADPRSPIAAENVRGITETVARFEAGKMAADPGGFLDGLERSARADPANGFLFGRTLALLEKQGWNGRALDLVALRLKVRPDDPMARDARTRLAGR